MDNPLLSKITYIFYVPGSVGSLLSILIQSQLDKNFIFNGFTEDTAHEYVNDAFRNTHNQLQYKDFKKSNITLEEHLLNNIYNDSTIQRLNIEWLEEFIKFDNLNKVLCYTDDYNLKLLNFYKKVGDKVLKSNEKIDHEIDKNHKDYETFSNIKTLNLMIRTEEKYLHKIPSINIDLVLKKEFTEFTKICNITNRTLLEKIIDRYNEKDIRNYDILPTNMKRYLKKYHTSV